MKIPWKRKWQATGIFLPGKFHRQSRQERVESIGSPRVGNDLVTEETPVFLCTQTPHLYLHIYPNLHIYIYICTQTPHLYLHIYIYPKMKVLGHVLFYLSFLRNRYTKSDHCFMTGLSFSKQVWVYNAISCWHHILRYNKHTMRLKP